MKDNYLTDKENTSEDFSDNFRNIKNHQKAPHFSYLQLPENRQ
jgi:hypothetical protein